MAEPQEFIDGNGWEFLNLEASDSDSDSADADEPDQDYTPSDADPDQSELDDEESDSASLVESEDDEDEEEEMEESEEEGGKAWGELEREATNADREKGDESDSEDERKRRKMKAFGKSRAGPSTNAPKRPKFIRMLRIVETETLLFTEEEPRNYKEASTDKKWIEAMEIELDSINKKEHMDSYYIANKSKGKRLK
ncbi:FACT complex subunit SPT16 [Tanacetum coccineum]